MKIFVHFFLFHNFFFSTFVKEACFLCFSPVQFIVEIHNFFFHINLTIVTIFFPTMGIQIFFIMIHCWNLHFLPQNFDEICIFFLKTVTLWWILLFFPRYFDRICIFWLIFWENSQFLSQLFIKLKILFRNQLKIICSWDLYSTFFYNREKKIKFFSKTIH